MNRECSIWYLIFKSGKMSITLVSLVLMITACGGSSSDTVTSIPNTPVVIPPVVTPDPEANTSPNILLIISDDQGLDASAQYAFSNDLPSTPNLDQLANAGLVFENAWASPACTTTRATLLTGKYGINSGVTFVPAELSNEHQVLQQYLATNSASETYASAVFGKWHLAGTSRNAAHPNQVGIEYYAGNLSNVSDYFDWELTTNGISETINEYHTTKITDLASDWIRQQSSPWFAWVAYSAPHAPFHLPPPSLHNQVLSGTQTDINNNPRDYYLAAIEAMDNEIGRLIEGLEESVRNNTVIIFMGDNGTPRQVIDTQVFANNHTKGTLYQGGVAVPLIISGAGVTRQNEREGALVTATDLFATIGEIAGIEQTNIHDSTSFAAKLTDSSASTNSIIFTQFESANTTGTTVRNEQYKLIQFIDGTRELYDLSQGIDESTNIIGNSEVTSELSLLSQFADAITGENNDQQINITNAILTNGNGNCADYIAQYTSNVNDIANQRAFIGDLVITLEGNKCIFETNAIPNHDFNDGVSAFANDVSEQNERYEIPAAPELAATTSSLYMRINNAIMLNGVKVDQLSAGCFGVGNGVVGCNDMSIPWRYDPMFSGSVFNVDTHNAHAQPNGAYHYHGAPNALFAQDSTQTSPVVGFAADGFPIYGSYIADGDIIRKAQSSFRLKDGMRPSGEGEPGGNYDGTFRDDYEFVEGLGDLDECNGTTINGEYGYYITENFPYILACFSGTPDESFFK